MLEVSLEELVQFRPGSDVERSEEVPVLPDTGA
jgi:hypothetical protein